MTDWITIGTTFGIPMLILAVIGYFVRSSVWPLVVKRIEQADAERQRVETERARERTEYALERAKERVEFLMALERRDTGLNILSENIKELTSGIKALRDDLRKGTRERP